MAIGALIVLGFHYALARSKRKAEKLSREIMEKKAQDVTREIHEKPLSDLVKRANERWGSKFEKSKGPRRSDPE